MWSGTACVAAALFLGMAPAHADEAPAAPVGALPGALNTAPRAALPKVPAKASPEVPAKALPEGPAQAPPRASAAASTEAPTEAPAEAPIEAAKLEVEHYQVEVNTPGVTLGTVDPVDPDAADIDFASDFYLDLESRRANLRLAGFDNELALDWDMRARNLKLRLAGGHMGTFFIAIDGDITLRRKPTIDARLILAIGGQKLELDLPKFRVDAKLREGDLQMEFVVPLIDGGF